MQRGKRTCQRPTLTAFPVPGRLWDVYLLFVLNLKVLPLMGLCRVYEPQLDVSHARSGRSADDRLVNLSVRGWLLCKICLQVSCPRGGTGSLFSGRRAACGDAQQPRHRRRLASSSSETYTQDWGVGVAFSSVRARKWPLAGVDFLFGGARYLRFLWPHVPNLTGSSTTMSDNLSKPNQVKPAEVVIKPPPSAPPGPPRRGVGSVARTGAVEVSAAASAHRSLWKYRGATGFLVSFGVHCVLLLVLALIVGSTPRSEFLVLVATPNNDGGLELGDETRVTLAPNGLTSFDSTDLTLPNTSVTLPLVNPPDSAVAHEPEDAGHRELSALDRNPRDVMLHVPNPNAGGTRGRTGALRGKLLAARGGTPQSQNAVALGLAWLVAHQHRDGGWRFDLELETGPCHGQCRDSGTVGTTTGATGLALLAMLGDGQTHLSGEYRDVVERGIYYLKAHTITTPHGADLQEGTMYAQGIATLALCEAYGLTQDESLRARAQRAVDFICYAQHSKGGWRYYPQQPGDTTVFGWQMMALKSAMMAGLTVPSPVMNLAERFLDSVQTEVGSFYGYVAPGQLPTPTAVGLLVRMYTGWAHEDSRLQRGVSYLAKLGPSQTDVYFDYYGTLVLSQYSGPKWDAWNQQLRDYLVASQATTGHERGSWFFPDQHGSKAGRLYTTAMSVMILEVYYRYMPLYGTRAVDFEL